MDIVGATERQHNSGFPLVLITKYLDLVRAHGRFSEHVDDVMISYKSYVAFHVIYCGASEPEHLGYQHGGADVPVVVVVVQFWL